MSDLTRCQIAAMTGLPASTLTRHLARFRTARARRGRYTTTDSAFAAWLTEASGGRGATDSQQVAHSTPEPREYPVDEILWLPSGLPVAGGAPRFLQRAEEGPALAYLDELVRSYGLRPHRNVPDPLPFIPLRLPSGQVVNESQWHIVRRGNEQQVRVAIDVLIRSWSDAG